MDELAHYNIQRWHALNAPLLPHVEDDATRLVKVLIPAHVAHHWEKKPSNV